MDDILYSMYFRKQWNEIRDKLLNSKYDLNRIILVPEKKKVDKLQSDWITAELKQEAKTNDFSFFEK